LKGGVKQYAKSEGKRTTITKQKHRLPMARKTLVGEGRDKERSLEAP